MIKPESISNMSEAMADVYGAVTDRILINLAHYFPYIKDSEEVSGSFEYQARMLAQMGQVNKETAGIIAEGLDGADEALQGALETSILDALKDEEPKLREAARRGFLGTADVPEVDPRQMNAFKAYYRQSADKLNLVNTVMLESTQTAYSATVSDIASRMQRTQTILNVGAGETISGVSTYNQAVRGAVKKMVDNGITGFIDHGGHRWSPEAYAAMDIRTTMYNTSRAAIWERNEAYGNDLYQVSHHNGARPLCYPWQGKIISRDDLAREVEDFEGNTVHVYAQSETTYGQAAGLFGVNCGHYPMVFIPGISSVQDVPQDKEENARTYEESQQQRALERKLREERRDLAVLKAQGAPEDEIRAQRERVKKASQDIEDFCDETGRTRRKDREGTPINAKFPPKDSYEPKEFPTAERDKMNDWFKNGGTGNPPPSPTNIHLGPNNIPPQGQMQIPVDPERIEFGELFDQEKSTEAVRKIDKQVRELYRIDEQLGFVGDVRITRNLPPDIDVFDLHDKYKKLVPAEAQFIASGNSVLNGKPLIEIHNEALGFEEPRTMFRKLFDIRQRTNDALFTATYGMEGTLLHEYGHFVADQYGVFGIKNWNGEKADEFNQWLNQYWREHDPNVISKYAASSPHEMFAEAFAQSFDIEHQDLPATKMANEIMEKFHEYIGFNPGR